MSAGRFAPSPTSDLHVGNLRTALLAWLYAESSGRPLLLRIEDLDQVRVASAGDTMRRQLADLAAFGITFAGDLVQQSDRLDVYAAAADQLGDQIYECFCTRREIREAAQAPHTGFSPYRGTCRDLSEAEKARRRAERPAAWRVRAEGASATITDLLHGSYTGTVDDFVIRRNDGTWAYNFAVVVDDLAMGIDQVVRGDDLLDSAPRQAWLARLLGGEAPTYAHVPLVVDDQGRRLAKRNGAVTLSDLGALGIDPVGVRSHVAASLGLAEPGERPTMAQLLQRFDPAPVPTTPWQWTLPAARA